MGYEAIGITDHVGPSNIDSVSRKITRASEELNDSMDLTIIPGVELTHIPPSDLPELAQRAKNMG